MPLVVWKYPTDIAEFVHMMPKGAQILTVQEQHGEGAIWALVDPEAPKEERRFRVYGTGHPIGKPGQLGIENGLAYIGTFQTMNGIYVWHVFEEASDEKKKV